MKNKYFQKGFILGFLAVLFIHPVIVSSRQVHAQESIGNMLESLKEKLGFGYSSDSSLPFIFSKDTPNYRAFAGDRKSGGDHRIMLEKDGFKIGMALLSAEIIDPKTASPSSSINLRNTKETSPSAQISKDKEATVTAYLLNQNQATSSATESALTKEGNNLIKQIQQQMENIDSGLKDLSQKIDNIRQEVNQIVSKAKLVEGKRERKVLFNDILIDIDMVYRLNEGGIKQEIILKNKDKLKNSFTFIVSPDDLVYRNLGHDIWYFYDASGSAMMRLPKSFAKDKKGALTSEVTVQISKQKGKNQMTVNIPIEWLEAPERIFPITIHTALEVIPERRTDYHGQIPSLAKTGRKNPLTVASNLAVPSAQTASSSADAINNSALVISSSSATVSTSSAQIPSPLVSSSPILTQFPTPFNVSPTPALSPTAVITLTVSPSPSNVFLNLENLSSGGLKEEK